MHRGLYQSKENVTFDDLLGWERFTYQQFEDWLFNVLLPFTAYAMLAGSAYVAHFHARLALFIVGAAMLLLFVGIHNTWDAVTYFVFVMRPEQREAERHR